ncbi:hypothetical protein, partial [Sporosarcina sp. SAFN-010]|uniref:hypothetical protein n=1 Tax=Sporosarcina sp. SAFN-010 TaxID=3387273 RepID=UPI003F7D3813
KMDELIGIGTQFNYVKGLIGCAALVFSGLSHYAQFAFLSNEKSSDLQQKSLLFIVIYDPTKSPPST